MQHTISAPTDGVVSDLRRRGAAGGGGRRARRRGPTADEADRAEETSHEQLHRVRGAPDPAQGGGASSPATYGREYFTRCARSGEKTTDLWLAIGKAGYLGINIPEEYGGGGGGIGDVAAVCEELAAQGCPLLMMVVSPAICGTVISRFGTEEQKQKWLPGICDGTETMAFAITEPDAGTNSHNITTTARRDGDEWLLKGQKIYISGVDEAKNVLVVARTEDAKTGKLKPCLFVVPTDAPGFELHADPDGDRQPRAAVPGVHRRRPAAGRRARRRRGRRPGAAVRRAQPRADHGGVVLDRAGALRARPGDGVRQGAARSSAPRSARHQGIAHPLAQSKIEIELARLMTQKAAALYEAGDDMGAGEAANMAKYAAAEAACDAADRAVQSHGGNGITQEYGVAGLLVAARAGRIAPVSREMILNFVGMHSLGLPKSY